MVLGWLKKLFSGNNCPQCGASWDGYLCNQCDYPNTIDNSLRNSRRETRSETSREASRDSGQVQAPEAVSRSGATAQSRSQAPEDMAGLDAAQFAPIEDDEAMKIIKASNNWTTAYLDSLNRIPDANLPRIKLINSGMVGEGLISPEELAHIHDIGRQMDEVSGDLHVAAHMAQDAVLQDREARAQLRAQKKAEAAERRRKHQEDVAHRRATDIFFLGRDVSKGLADRRGNIEKLNRGGLPVLSTPLEVATSLNISISQLRFLAFHSEASQVSHYVRFTVPKKSGGERQLAAPHQSLAKTQRWILDNVLTRVEAHPAAHGFIKQRSTLTNAKAHLKQALVLNCDLEDFFPSITVYRVIGLFQSLGYSPAVSTIFALLTTECPRESVNYEGTHYHVATAPRALPQGACTSPAISNLICRKLDRRFTGICQKLGWTYTRYADDLSFSHPDKSASIGYLMARIRHIVQDESFSVNENKTRVQRQSARQSVTGITVNEIPSIDRKTIRTLRAILHKAANEGLEAQNRENRPNFNAWVHGMVAYINMVNPHQGAKLKLMLEKAT